MNKHKHVDKLRFVAVTNASIETNVQLFSAPICRPNDAAAAETFLIAGGDDIEAVEDAFTGEADKWSVEKLLKRIGDSLGVDKRIRKT
jgi:hypothetical protein